MKKFKLIGLSFLLLSISFGQTEKQLFYSLFKQGDSLSEKENYQAAADAYSKALKLTPFLSGAYHSSNIETVEIYAVNAAIMAENPDHTFSLLYSIIHKNKNNLDYLNLLNETYFYNPIQLLELRYGQKWSLLKFSLDKYIKEAEAKINYYLQKTIDSMLYLEGINKPEGYNVRASTNRTLSETKKGTSNISELSKIFDAYGWPAPDIIGSSTNLEFYRYLLSSDLKTREKYTPLMREAVKKGAARASDLAYVVDVTMIEQNKKQLYGTQVRVKKEDVYEPAPIWNERSVNERREVMGLSPLEEYLKHYKIKYEVPQSMDTTFTGTVRKFFDHSILKYISLGLSTLLFIVLIFFLKRKHSKYTK